MWFGGGEQMNSAFVLESSGGEATEVVESFAKSGRTHSTRGAHQESTKHGTWKRKPRAEFC